MQYKILFLNRNFYKYDQFIKSEFERNGHIVYDFNINADGNLFYYFLTHINKLLSEKFLLWLDRKLQQTLLENLKQSKLVINVIFVLAGQSLRWQTLEELKLLYPKAKFIWYIWDNTVYLKDFPKNKKYFDNIISFDIIESERLKLNFLPLFYTKKFIKWVF